MSTAKNKPRKSRWAIQLLGREDNSVLSEVSQQLLGLEFKPLTRPMPRTGGRTRNELRWAIRLVSAFGMCSFRDMLRTYLVLRDHELEAASFLVLRSMFEILAVSNYVAETFASHMSADETEGAWQLLDTIVTASKFVRIVHNPPYSVPDPLKIGLCVESLDKLDLGGDKGWAYRDYRFLSEFSHPDAMMFTHYCQLDRETGQATFYNRPEVDKGFLRVNAGRMVMMAGQIFGRLFKTAGFITQERQLARIFSAFQRAERLHIQRLPIEVAG
jgi:hypothetical protein